MSGPGALPEYRIIAYTPQPRLIQIRQLFRIRYASFELDTVNIDWWLCINVCLVYTRHYTWPSAATSRPFRLPEYCSSVAISGSSQAPACLHPDLLKHQTAVIRTTKTGS